MKLAPYPINVSHETPELTAISVKKENQVIVRVVLRHFIIDDDW